MLPATLVYFPRTVQGEVKSLTGGEGPQQSESHKSASEKLIRLEPGTDGIVRMREQRQYKACSRPQLLWAFLLEEEQQDGG